MHNYEKSRWLKKCLTYNVLYDLYINKKLSTTEIAKQFNTYHTTILRYLKKFGIKIRTLSESRKGINVKVYIQKQLSYDTLYNLYWVERKNTVEIAKIFKTQPSIINNYLKKFEIDVRTNSEAHIGLQSGSNHPNWKGGISNLPYSFEFNNNLKQQVRERDNYTCQNCGMTEEEHLIVYGTNLHVHHIDYDKQNCSEENLISLCLSCHVRTNYNRNYWLEIFNKKMEEEKNASN